MRQKPDSEDATNPGYALIMVLTLNAKVSILESIEKYGSDLTFSITKIEN